ncbi:rare lipoprotein A [Candidatus Magnetoovum chiemensis]|nr:rare lipoprotein A [Candidatus Magnetoovum chiemensis]
MSPLRAKEKFLFDSAFLMNRVKAVHFLLVFLTIAIASCSSVDNSTRPGQEFYVPDSSKIKPSSEKDKTWMTASWYGGDFHGRRTASGERYNMYAQTAAHKTLPFGTILKITNPENGLSTKVTVTDRGPFIPGRDLDLSYGAACTIDMVNDGVTEVLVTKIGRDNSYEKYVKIIDDTKPSLRWNRNRSKDYDYTIQIAALSTYENAIRLKQSLELNYDGVYIQESEVNGKNVYRVRIGTYKEKEKAVTFAKSLAYEGYETIVIDKQS